MTFFPTQAIVARPLPELGQIATAREKLHCIVLNFHRIL
jgi:hypothetical protein